MFVSSENKTEVILSDRMSKHPGNFQKKQNNTMFVPWKCHYCGRNGHTRPYCFDLYGHPKQSIPPKINRVVTKEWRPKGINTCHIAHTTLRTSKKWYFDSGCSKHMTGIKKNLVDIKPIRTSFVTFGDEASGEIKGIRKMACTCFPRLDDVLLMEGLTANLISISQLCDQGLIVTFNKSECLVIDEENSVLMKGERSKDNCYLWRPKEGSDDCESCQFRRKTKMSKQKLGHPIVSRALEIILVHVGDIQVKSTDRERSSHMIDDGYSCVNEINLSRNMQVFEDICQRLQRRTNRM